MPNLTLRPRGSSGLRCAATALVLLALTGCGANCAANMSGLLPAGNTGRAGMAGAGSSGGGTPTTYTVRGTVAGLTGSGHLPIAGNGPFTFSTPVQTNAAYSVSASSQPAVSREICAASNASGLMGAANVTSVTVNCSLVMGFLYQSQYLQNQILAYGLDASTGVPVPFGSPLATGANPLGIVASSNN